MLRELRSTVGDTISVFFSALTFGFRAAPLHASGQFATDIILGLRYPAIAFLGKQLINAASAGDWHGALIPVLLLTLGSGVFVVALFLYLHCLCTVVDRAKGRADRKLMEVFGGLRGLNHHENPEYLDEVQRIREERGGLHAMVNVTSGLLNALVTFAVSAVLLVGIHPVLIALIVLGFVSMWFSKRVSQVHISAQEDSSAPERLRRHLFDVGTSASHGKELRAYGAIERILAKHHSTARGVIATRSRADWRVARMEVCDAAVRALGVVGAVSVVLLLLIYGGTATVGDLVMVLGLAAGLGHAVGMATTYGGSFLIVFRVAQRFARLEGLLEAEQKFDSACVEPPVHLQQGIELQNVTFSYPGTSHEVLSDVTLTIPAGAVVAIVGDNGAGKTSLIKLLLQFYRPTSGRITVDGVDLQQIRSSSWRERVTGAFQDFVTFEFAIRESVGISRPESIGDDAALYGALDDVGMVSAVSTQAKGLDTQLGSRWPGGVDLSGGQRQRLALGRSLLRRTPLLTVLDEPSASLDAQTEHELFMRFGEIARRTVEERGATILVSHRFSTVQMADLIVVLTEGQIREIGSHEELVRRNGLYAELYGLQSRGYQ